MLKLQTLSIIFVLIIVPVTILLSYYIDTQIDTIALQNSYDAKLLNATYDAIVAFELNTKNNTYSNNAESLRRDINASINTFTQSLANNFGVSGSKNQFLAYVPAVLYTLYDGYYIYAPIANNTVDINGNPIIKYEHTLKPYIYYTARYVDNPNSSSPNYDFVVNYSLDNYIVIYGKIGSQGYKSKAGYLINTDDNKYSNIAGNLTGDALTYYNDAKEFTSWVNNNIGNTTLYKVDEYGGTPEKIESGSGKSIFCIDKKNDPDNKTSLFVEHKSSVIKNSIQSNLNAAIANYNKKSEGLGTLYDFKMPILDETEWDKMLSNVSIISFMQGLPVGIKKYNNYMIVTSTKNKQYVDDQSLYFVGVDSAGKEGEYYHKINCSALKKEVEAGKTIIGYKTIDFDGTYTTTTDAYGNTIGKYDYNGHTALACYECIVSSRVGNVGFNNKNLIFSEQEIKDNFGNNTNHPTLRALRNAYYNALFKERQNLKKVSSYVNATS